MLGIKEIAHFLPETRKDNRDLMETFDIDEAFLRDKIGVMERRALGPDETASDMAVAALEALLAKSDLDVSEIDALVVVTQNPDSNIPHVSGLVHGRMGLPARTLTFDISLGCSGYVIGLSVLTSVMQANGFANAVLITSDPYSKVVQPEDKNTVLLFGDGATATWIGQDPVFVPGHFSFGSKGDLDGALATRDGALTMDGRAVFTFAAGLAPKSVRQTLEQAGLETGDIDSFLFHQGSKYIIDTLATRLKLPREKVVNGLEKTGNTVSSSIPMLIEPLLRDGSQKRLLLCGFGVGLSYASCICTRKENT